MKLIVEQKEFKQKKAFQVWKRNMKKDPAKYKRKKPKLIQDHDAIIIKEGNTRQKFKIGFLEGGHDRVEASTLKYPDYKPG